MHLRTIIALQVLAASAALAQDPPPADCEVSAPQWNVREFTCKAAPGASAQRLQFKVSFFGSHDDTRLTLTPKLNDQPLTCDVGGKVFSEGEDGEVTLLCQFPVPQDGDRTHEFKARLSIHHAEYSGFEFGPAPAADPPPPSPEA